MSIFDDEAYDFETYTVSSHTLLIQKGIKLDVVREMLEHYRYQGNSYLPDRVTKMLCQYWNNLQRAILNHATAVTRWRGAAEWNKESYFKIVKAKEEYCKQAQANFYSSATQGGIKLGDNRQLWEDDYDYL